MDFLDFTGYCLSLIHELFSVQLIPLYFESGVQYVTIGHVIIGTLIMCLAIHFLVPNFSN